MELAEEQKGELGYPHYEKAVGWEARMEKRVEVAWARALNIAPSLGSETLTWERFGEYPVMANIARGTINWGAK
jgi:hypothetical protein